MRNPSKPRSRLATIGFASAILFAARSGRGDDVPQGQEPRGPAVEDVPGAFGFHGGLPYLHDAADRVRLYPEAAVRIDADYAPVPDGLAPAFGTNDAGARLVLRRLRLGLSGEVSHTAAFTAELEMGGLPIGQTPYVGSLTRRWVPADVNQGVFPAEVSMTGTVSRSLNFTVGQFAAPFSLSNRTPESATTFLERPLAIRGFVVPYDRVLGAMTWGELSDRAFAYEVGVFSGGTGQTVDPNDVDAMGRVFVRPFTRLGRGVFFELAQIGLSARAGLRDPSRDVGDLPSLATGQGFVLWQPGHVDGSGRVIRALPSGPQRAVGGELRLPVRTPTRAVFDLRAEAYVVQSDTREAVSGFEATSLRLGMLSGLSWYVSLDWWACFIPGFDQLVTGEPGISRPPSLDDKRIAVPKGALEASVTAGGVNANYDASSRWGSVDPREPAGAITVYQLGGAVQYLFGTNLRAIVEYMAYLAPDSGNAAETAVVVPDNLPRTNGATGGGHVAHEVGLRFAAGF